MAGAQASVLEVPRPGIVVTQKALSVACPLVRIAALSFMKRHRPARVRRWPEQAHPEVVAISLCAEARFYLLLRRERR